MHPLLYLPFATSLTISIIMIGEMGSDNNSIKVLILTTGLGFMTTLLQAFIAAHKTRQQRRWDIEDHERRLQEMREEDRLERTQLAESLRIQTEATANHLLTAAKARSEALHNDLTQQATKQTDAIAEKIDEINLKIASLRSELNNLQPESKPAPGKDAA